MDLGFSQVCHYDVFLDAAKADFDVAPMVDIQFCTKFGQTTAAILGDFS